MVYTLRFFFSLKYILFHNSNLFGSCTIHILYTECAKIKKIIPASNGSFSFHPSVQRVISLWNNQTIFTDFFAMRGDDLPRDELSGICHEVGCSHRGLQKFFLSFSVPPRKCWLIHINRARPTFFQIQHLQSPPFNSTLHEPRIAFRRVNNGDERHR